MKNKNKLIMCLFAFVLSFISLISVEAKTIKAEDIPNNSYVIGTHNFTAETVLTTKHIMLAAKTIEGNSLEDMKFYYKTPWGDWWDGLSGDDVTPPASFNINYTDLELEEENDTVKAPDSPTFYLDGPLTFNKENAEFSYQLIVYMDDIENPGKEVDGLEITETNYKGEITNKDIKSEDFYVTHINENFNDHEHDLEIGKDYHAALIKFNTISSQTTRYAVRAYRLDSSGKKYYSDWKYMSVDNNNSLPALKVVNPYSNPDYVIKDENNYTYSLGIEIPVHEVFNNLVYRDNFRYVLYEKSQDGTRQIGLYKLDEIANITIPKDSVRSYYALIGYYNNEDKFIHHQVEVGDKLFNVDTRELTAPVLSHSSSGADGEYLKINKDFYEAQDETTLDSTVKHAEIYEIFVESGELKYKLVSDTFTFKHVFPKNGSSQFVARVYATDVNGNKVYSDYSNVITVVRTPVVEYTRDEFNKVKISIVNKDEFDKYIKFKVYGTTAVDGETEIATFEDIDDIPEVELGQYNTIYVKAINTDGVESQKSNRHL